MVTKVKEKYEDSSLGERLETHTINKLTDSGEQIRNRNRKGGRW